MVSAARLKKTLVFTLFSLFFSFAQTSYAEKKEVRLGVLAIWGKKTTQQMWQPTINYLNKTIPEYRFTLKPLKLKQTTNAVKNNALEFILTNPGNYISLEANFGISRLATLKIKKQNHVTNQFSSIIFTRNDRDDIQSLKDLRNKSFMGVKKTAFGGFQMAWLELKNEGINPFEDFSSLHFSGLPQDKIVYAVLNGEIDAGTVRTATLEHMAEEKLIDISKLKIINRKTETNFPWVHSTRLYPEWPIAKLKNTSDELAKVVSIALLKLPENSSVAKKARIAGWTVPLDYFPVRNLFKELNLAPYQTRQPSFLDRYWLYLLLLLMLLAQPLFFYIRKLRINLRIDEDKLAQSETEWSNALDFLDEPMYMVDLNDRIIRANKAFYKKINSRPNTAVGKTVTDFTHPEGEEIPCKVCQARKDLIDTTITLEADDPANSDGVPLDVSIKVVRNKENHPIGIMQRMRDLTQTRIAEKTFRRNELLFKKLLDSTPDPLIVANSDGTIVLVNTQFEKQIGYTRKEMIGHKVEKLIPYDLRGKHIDLRNGFSLSPEYRPMTRISNLTVLDKYANIIPVEISLSPFAIDNEKMIIATLHNISKRIEKELELKRLASFPELNPIPIIEFKKDATITYANPAAIEVFPDINNPDHIIFSDIDIANATSKGKHELIRNIEFDGSTFEQKVVFNPETNLYRMYIWDITKLRNLTQKMTYQATHDALTNLINRREFERRLEQSIEDAKLNNKTHSLCYMDLDQFKTVNDSCGHAAGDELLKQLSQTINTKIRETDTFARLGGDEFGLLLESCPVEKALMLAEEVRKEVEKFRFHWDNKTFKVGISIGIVTINKTSISTRNILSSADTACYIAKEKGRNRVYVYETDIHAVTKHTNETNWLNRIHTSLDTDNFILYFQKISSLHNNDKHYEVLIRMIDDNGMTIPPGSFIPAAERFDVMTSIDSWVIKHTLLIMGNDKYQNINFSINLSGQSLSDIKFMQECISQIEYSHVSPSRLCFEITETAMIANLTNAIRSVSTLRELGCTIALDDFGSGLSSFAYLKNLPVDFLKIDGSLIKELENDPINVTMVESIIHIGHSMGLKTIAEYVENDAAKKLLQDMNIDFVQGYGIAKPVPIEDIKT